MLIPPRHLFRGRGLRRQIKRALQPVLQATLDTSRQNEPGTWGLQIVDGRLHAGAVDLAALPERFGSPLHVVLGEKLRHKLGRAQQIDGGAPVEMFFSYKTNPIPGVLGLLHQAGLGAEVISPYELWLAEQLGVPPEKIVFGGPAKGVAGIRRAIELDIRLINVNHREELDLVRTEAAALGRRARVALRVSPPGGWSWQFGLAVDGGEAREGFRAALSAPELEGRGQHVHLGELIHSRAELEHFLDPVLAFCDTLHDELGFEPELLDLGGSLAVPTLRPKRPLESRLARSFLVPPPPTDPSRTLALHDYSAAVASYVGQHFAARQRRVPTLILEPGRAVSADLQLLLCSVLSIKRRAEPPDFAILDAGLNIAEPVLHAHHTLFCASRSDEPTRTTWRLAGPTCTPYDELFDAWRGPALQAGDVLAIMDAGAYLVPFSTQFSFPRPGVVLVDGDRVELLRRAETFEDLVRCDQALRPGSVQGER